MRLVDVILISIMLCLFSVGLSETVYQVQKMDAVISELSKKTESLDFISRSFCNLCSGKGFRNFNEWENTCSAMWKLEKIEWESVGGDLYRGRWIGACGCGEVYCRVQGSVNES